MEGAGAGQVEATAAAVVTVVASRSTRTCFYLASLTQKDGILLRLKFRVRSGLFYCLTAERCQYHQLIELGR